MAPSWGAGPWLYEVSEESPPNTVVTVLKAVDPDTIGSLKYSLVTSETTKHDLVYDNSPMSVDKDIESHFKLDPMTGQLRLAEALDREIRERYVLKVRADDGVQHTDINLIIQVNKLH